MNTGILVGLLLASTIITFKNATKPVDLNGPFVNLRFAENMARSVVRVFGLVLLFASLGGLIGSLIQ